MGHRADGPLCSELIRQGYRDINEIKAVSRAGMGACGAKTCTGLIHRLFRDEGISQTEVVDQTLRPLFMEVPLSAFAGIVEKHVATAAGSITADAG
jgi:sarcosine oxidase subunit alpha